jgi:hypothetical protein
VQPRVGIELAPLAHAVVGADARVEPVEAVVGDALRLLANIPHALNALTQLRMLLTTGPLDRHLHRVTVPLSRAAADAATLWAMLFSGFGQES